MNTTSLSSPLRDRAYRRYWLAFTTSSFGDGVSSVAVPLTAVVTLHVNAMQLGTLTALTWIPSLLLSMTAGAWVDRVGRKRMKMIWSNICSFVTLAIVSLIYAVGLLETWQLYFAVFFCGAFSVVYNVCDATLFATLLRPANYIKGQSLLFGSAAVGSLAGPAVAGLLLEQISPPWVIAVDSASFACSAILLASIHPQEPARKFGESGGFILGGLRFVRNNLIIRKALLGAATSNLFYEMFQAIIFLYLTAALHFTSGSIGLLLASRALGGVSGSAVANKLACRFGVGYTLLIGSLGISTPLFFIIATRSLTGCLVVIPAVAFFCSGLGRAVQNISIGTVFLITVPGDLRSRVRGAFQTVSTGTRTFGALLGGILGTLIGLRVTLGIAAFGGSLACLWLIRSNLLKLHHPRDRSA